MFCPSSRLIMLPLTIVGLCLGVSCSREEVKDVHLERRAVQNVTSSAHRVRPIKIGMGAMITPKEGFIYYLKLKEYLEKKLHRPVQLVDRDNYEQISKMLEKGELEMSFISSGPYVECHDRFGLELVVVPQVNGKSVYHSYVIVPQDSLARKLGDLRGKSFAFTDPKSNSGTLVPTDMLARMNETPNHFFKKVIYTYGHDKSIKAVAERLVDGAAVNSIIWNYLAATTPEIAQKTRIIVKSQPFAIPPLAVRPDYDRATVARIREVLLTMHEDPEGKEILRGMMIDRFVLLDDKAYDDVRKMSRWLPAKGKGK